MRQMLLSFVLVVPIASAALAQPSPVDPHQIPPQEQVPDLQLLPPPGLGDVPPKGPPDGRSAPPPQNQAARPNRPPAQTRANGENIFQSVSPSTIARASISPPSAAVLSP